VGGTTIKAARTATAVPLVLQLNTATGGATGLAPTVRVTDASSAPALPSDLDFSDDTFKTVGWVTRDAAMTELGLGAYKRTLDVSAITNLPAGTDGLEVLYRETTLTAGTVGALDYIELDDQVEDLNDLAQSQVLSDATPFAGANIDAAITSRNSVVPMTAALSQTEHDATQTAIAGIGAAPTTAQIADAVLDDDNSLRSAANSTAVALNRTRFDGVVHLDTVNGSAGTALYRGTQDDPVDNLNDAIAIMQAQGIRTLKSWREGFGAAVEITAANVVALNAIRPLVIGGNWAFEATALPDGHRLDFWEAIDGRYTGNIGPGTFSTFASRFTNCDIDGKKVTREGLLSSHFIRCVLSGTFDRDFAIGGGSLFVDCSGSESPWTIGNSSLPTFDGDAGIKDVFFRFGGRLILENVSSAAVGYDFDLLAGELTLGSGCTSAGAGGVTVTGVGQVFGTFASDVVDRRTLAKADKVLTNKVVVNPTDTQVDVYKDDDVTIDHSYSISADRRTRTPL